MSLRVFLAFLTIPFVSSVWPCGPNTDDLSDSPGTQALQAADHFVDVGTPPRLAWSQGVYGAVWEDFDNQLQGQLLFMRFDNGGEPLDPEPIVIAKLGPGPAAPAIAASDSDFLIVWQDASEGYDIVGTLAPLFDSVEERLEILVLADDPNFDEAEPTVAANDNGFLVGWTVGVGTADSQIVVQWLDSSGAPLGNPIPAPRSDIQHSPTLAVDDSSAFLAWVERNGQVDALRHALLVPPGEWITGNAIAGQGGYGALNELPLDAPGRVSLASDGKAFWLVWEKSRGPSASLLLAQVDAVSGTLTQVDELQVKGSDPALALAPWGVTLLWTDVDGQLVFSEFDPSGQLVDAAGSPISTPSAIVGRNVVAGGDDALLTVWRESYSGEVALYASRLEPSTPVSPQHIQTFPDTANCPSLATDGEGYLMVWRQGPWLAGKIQAVLLDAGGNRISPDIRLAQQESMATCPSVAFNDGNFLAVWQSVLGGKWPVVQGKIVDKGGSSGPTLNGSPNPPYRGDLLPHVGMAPGGFLVGTRQPSNPHAVSATFVSGSTGGMGAPFLVAQGASHVVDVKVAGGDPPLVTWATDLDVYAAPVTLPSCPPRGCIVEHVGSAKNPMVALATAEGAFNGGRAVVWHEDGAFGGALTLVEISDQGVPFDQSVLMSGGTHPALAWNSQSLLLAWADSSGHRATASQVSSDLALFGAPSQATIGSSLPSIASASKESALLAYALEGPGGSSTVEVMPIAWSSFGAPCSEDSECGGFCVDGVCCESACGDGNACMACSIARGSSADGRCEPVPAGVSCESQGACVLVSSCDGQGACVPDELAPSTTLCRPAAGPCDIEEYCTGRSPECPSDKVADLGHVCRPSQGACDLSEQCDGVSPTCPFDQLAPITESCIAGVGSCAVVTWCSGISATCPTDELDPICVPSTADLAPLPPLGVIPTFHQALAFLYEGETPVQQEVVPGAIKEESLAVISGRIRTASGTGIPGAAIRVRNFPEYGVTHSQADGAYDLALNGHGNVLIEVTLDGYFPVQRHTYVTWNDWIRIDDIVLLPFDSRVTTIDTANSPVWQVAQGTPMTDQDGTRTATVLFPSGTTATLLRADGTEIPVSSLDVRATEYTVGPDGPLAMPGELPAPTGYTYAVELSADQAVNIGADHVLFNQPVMFYVDNFLGFDVGERVPMGFYDRKSGTWLPSEDGNVIGIVGVNGGLTEIDLDGDGLAESASELEAIGVTSEERIELASLYAIGQELWRVPIPHFSPWDCNWPIGGPPLDAIPPNAPDPIIQEPEDEGSVRPSV